MESKRESYLSVLRSVVLVDQTDRANCGNCGNCGIRLRRIFRRMVRAIWHRTKPKISRRYAMYDPFAQTASWGYGPFGGLPPQFGQNAQQYFPSPIGFGGGQQFSGFGLPGGWGHGMSPFTQAGQMSPFS